MSKLYYIANNAEDLLAVEVDGMVYTCGEYYMQNDEYYQQHRSELKNWEDYEVRKAAAVGYLNLIAEYNNADCLSANWDVNGWPFPAEELEKDDYEIVAVIEIG